MDLDASSILQVMRPRPPSAARRRIECALTPFMLSVVTSRISDSRSSVLLPQRVVSGNALWRREGDSEGAQALEDERRSLQARKSAGSRVAGGPALRENARAAPVPLGGTTSGYGSTAGDLAGRGSAALNSPAERRQRRAPLRESTGSSIAGQSPGPFRTSAVRGVRALAANGMAAQGPLGARQTWQGTSPSWLLKRTATAGNSRGNSTATERMLSTPTPKAQSPALSRGRIKHTAATALRGSSAQPLTGSKEKSRQSQPLTPVTLSQSSRGALARKGASIAAIASSASGDEDLLLTCVIVFKIVTAFTS